MSKTKIINENFFVIRTPRMPVNKLLAFDTDKQKTRQLIANWLSKPGVVEALYLASPSLLDRIEYWETKPESKQGRKVELALLKYMIRMGSRPTPFGLFSGVHMGQIGEATSIRSRSYEQDSRKTRLDILYLSAVKEHLLRTNSRSEYIQYYPNSSHYFISGQCRYIESYQSNNTHQYRLSAIESDEYFNFLLQSAKNGINFRGLVSRFMGKYAEAALEDVEGFVQQFIDESILVADVPLPLTGQSPDTALVKSLYSVNANSVADHLNTVLHFLEKVDEKKIAEIKDYKGILSHLCALPVEVQESKLFQADVYRNFRHCEFSQDSVSRLLNQLVLLKGLGRKGNNFFSDFISRFNARFEGQLVPLNKLLDDETGISFSHETGYESPLLAGLRLAKSNGQNPTATVNSALDNIIIRAISEPENRTKSVVHLKSKELRQYLNNRSVDSELPTSFAATISLYQDKRKNPIVKFNGCYGPSSANLLGRFCHLDKELTNKVKTHLEREEKLSPDVIFAEIVHMPEGRPGNVIARPHLRKYEIVFMADSDLNLDFQIPTSDLYVWIEGQQVKLWSKRLNKQVIPRLSSAHNYSSRSLSVYKFLSMVQIQSGGTPGFSLPSGLSSARFIPRIMLDNLILSEKKWRVPRKELSDVLKGTEINFAQLDTLQRKYQLDDWVSYAVNDNVLQLNLRNYQMLEILLSETKARNEIELKEVLATHYETPVRSENDEYFTNELIIPFLNKSADKHQSFKNTSQMNLDTNQNKRRFSPGSEWLSLKLYSGNSSVEALLAEKLLPLIEANKQYFDKWFFIRYADPDWHLRVRFHGKPANLYGKLLMTLNDLLEPMIEDGEIHKIELFTYEREVERYGGTASMPHVESLFMADSRLIAKVTQLLSEYGEEFRWRITLFFTDSLLSLFNYTNEEKLDLISQLRSGFGNEFNESSTLRKQLGNRYREIEAVLKDDFAKLQAQKSNEFTESQTVIFSLVQQWRKEVIPHVQAIIAMIENDEPMSCTKDSLLGSLLHMHNNRMFKAYGRELELVMHDFLRRFYFSNEKQQ